MIALTLTIRLHSVVDESLPLIAVLRGAHVLHPSIDDARRSQFSGAQLWQITREVLFSEIHKILPPPSSFAQIEGTFFINTFFLTAHTSQQERCSHGGRLAT